MIVTYGICDSACSYALGFLIKKIGRVPIFVTGTVYRLDSRLLTPVVCFAELVKTGLWVIWAEPHTPYTQFLPRGARKECTKDKE